MMLLKRFTNLNKKYNLGLVLSGGGARGFAHLGVLKALNEKGIYPDIISGVSSGAIAGIFYANGYTPQEIFDFLKDKKLFKFIQVTIPRTGFLRITGFLHVLKEKLKVQTFEELEPKVILTTTNLNTGKSVTFSHGEILKPLLASVSMPVLFSPVKINNQLYADGGLLDNLPLNPIKDQCKKLIGVNVNPVGQDDDIHNLRDIAERTFSLSVSGKLSHMKEKFDYYIEPQKLINYSLIRLSKAQEIFDIGYEEAMKIMDSHELKTRKMRYS